MVLFKIKNIKTGLYKTKCSSGAVGSWGEKGSFFNRVPSKKQIQRYRDAPPIEDILVEHYHIIKLDIETKGEDLA